MQNKLSENTTQKLNNAYNTSLFSTKPFAVNIGSNFAYKDNLTNSMVNNFNPKITDELIPALFTKVNENETTPIKMGDSASDVSAKIFNILEKDRNHKKIDYELNKNFKQEQYENDKKHHEELIKAIEEVKSSNTNISNQSVPDNLKLKTDDPPEKTLFEKVKDTVGGAASKGKRGYEKAKDVAKKAVPVAAGGVLLLGAALRSKQAKFVQGKEGFSSTAYPDPSKKNPNAYSIGYGHQINDEDLKRGYLDLGDEKVKIQGKNGEDTKLTVEQANKLFDKDYGKYQDYAENAIGRDRWNKLNYNQKIAFTDYAYNAGPGNFKSFVEKNDINRLIDNNDFDKVSEIIRDKGARTRNVKNKDGTTSSVVSQELIKRRDKESKLFLETPDPQLVEVDKNSKLYEESKKNAMNKLDEDGSVTVIDNTTNVLNNQIPDYPQNIINPTNPDKPAILNEQ